MTRPCRPAVNPPGCARLRRWWWADLQTEVWKDEQVRRCDEVLDHLQLPQPFHLEQLRTALERSRGRRLQVITARTRFPEPRAMWCGGAKVDYILVGSAGPAEYRDHLVLHGIGHMIFGHHGSPAVAQPLNLMLNELDLARLGHRTRVIYTRREEREAEAFATHVQLLTAQHPEDRSTTDQAPVLARLSSVLEYHPRHRIRP